MASTTEQQLTQVTIRLADKPYDTTVDMTDEEYKTMIETGEFFGDPVSRVLMSQLWSFDAWLNFRGPARGLVTLIYRG